MYNMVLFFAILFDSQLPYKYCCLFLWYIISFPVIYYYNLFVSVALQSSRHRFKFRSTQSTAQLLSQIFIVLNRRVIFNRISFTMHFTCCHLCGSKAASTTVYTHCTSKIAETVSSQLTNDPRGRLFAYSLNPLVSSCFKAE